MIQVGDRVAFAIGSHRGAGEVDRLLPANVVAVRRDDGNFAYPLLSECVPVEDAPQGVVSAVLDDEPLLLDEEPIQLGEVGDEDALIGASLDAATLLVRICQADNLPLRERVVLNGITWLVTCEPEPNAPGGIPAE